MIYLATDGELLKIGKSDNIPVRMNSLALELKKPVRCLSVISGGFKEERKTHKLFERFKFAGEWYYTVDEILKYFRSHPLKTNQRCIKPKPQNKPELIARQILLKPDELEKLETIAKQAHRTVPKQIAWMIIKAMGQI